MSFTDNGETYSGCRWCGGWETHGPDNECPVDIDFCDDDCPDDCPGTGHYDDV